MDRLEKIFSFAEKQYKSKITIDGSSYIDFLDRIIDNIITQPYKIAQSLYNTESTIACLLLKDIPLDKMPFNLSGEEIDALKELKKDCIIKNKLAVNVKCFETIEQISIIDKLNLSFNDIQEVLLDMNFELTLLTSHYNFDLKKIVDNKIDTVKEKIWKRQS